jgi:hypothetical protein
MVTHPTRLHSHAMWYITLYRQRRIYHGLNGVKQEFVQRLEPNAVHGVIAKFFWICSDQPCEDEALRPCGGGDHLPCFGVASATTTSPRQSIRST